MKSTVMQNLVTQFFSVDHERLDFLFRMYQKNKQNQRYKAVLLFDKFSEGLKRHIRWEEELLFPMFEKATGINGSGPTMVMRHEHDKIRAMLDEISESLKNDDHSEALEKALSELLLLHNEKEEQVLYVQCDRALKEEQLLTLFLDM